MAPSIDVVVLTRDGAELDSRVEHALREQRGVTLQAYRVVGARRATDRTRWDTIARARNHAIGVGAAPYVLFLDDDVQLAPDAAWRLFVELLRHPAHAALAANFLGEPRSSRPAPHVAMGATLFRRQALKQIRFRWEAGKCECRCCCEDLRTLGWELDYLDTAGAIHLRPYPKEFNAHGVPRGHILVAFNRRHVQKFCSRFLRTLRAAGNHDTVHAVAYGLYPSERRQLQRSAGVEVIPLAVNGTMPPIRRLIDFQPVIADWPDRTPVAYWDAGDVVFQDNLAELWRLTQQYPSQLLAVREPRGYPYNPAVTAWALSIHDPRARREAFELFARSPFLNSGFAAGTADAMRRYLYHAASLRQSPALAGTSDWGDQTAMNLYCHREPDAWREIPQGWNYCLHDRHPGEVTVSPDGRIHSRRGTPIYVAHGNACSLRKLELVR